MKRGPSSSQFNYYGWFCGLVPVYVANPYKGIPELEVRWWCPHLVLDIVRGAYESACIILEIAGAEAPILITGRIHRSLA